MSSSVGIRNQGVDHRAISGASYASDRKRQLPRQREIRIWHPNFINTGKNIDTGKMSHRPLESSLLGYKSGSKYEMTSFFPLILAICVPVFAFFDVHASAETNSAAAKLVLKPELASRLTVEFRSAVTDRPLRDALDSIASAAKVNLWLDRRTDPTVLISSATQARTPFQAISSVAQAAGLRAIAIDNVVVIGREQWVETVLGELLSHSFNSPLKTVSWPPLTTPTVAVTSIEPLAKGSLPHDLWPAVRWTEIQPEVGHVLIAAQFDLLPDRIGSGSYRKLAHRNRVSALYPQGSHMPAVRAAVTAEDKAAKFKEIDSRVLVNATPKAHVAAINRWLAAPPVAPVKLLDIDEVRFTLRLENAVAEQVFRQFAAAAGRTIVFSPQAAESCKKTVSLTANDETLRDLSQRVADAAKVKLTWTANQLDVMVE